MKIMNKNHSNLVKTHFNVKYYNYDILIKKLIPRYDYMHKLIVNSINFPINKYFRVLDLGIGTGQTALNLLKKFPNIKIDGVDISSKMIIRGKKRLKNFLNKVNFIKKDIKDLKLKNKYYGVCVAVLCVHHLNQDEKKILFKKIFNSLVLGGIFVIGDIIRFNSDIKTKEKEKVWKKILEKNLGKKEANFWFKNYQEEDLPDSIGDQIQWLKEAGFKRVKSLWRYINYSVIYAKK